MTWTTDDEQTVTIAVAEGAVTEIPFDCTEGKHEEASTYPSHPCWGWMKTHTYHLTELVSIQRIIGEVKVGISENPSLVKTCYIEISENGIDWQQVYTFQATYAPVSAFDTGHIGKTASWFRIHADPDAAAAFVDYSKGKVVVR